MPSHIFTRVGHWHDSIASNLISAKVAKDDREPDDQLHAMDYLVYAYLQIAQDNKAREVVEEMRRTTGVNAARHTGPFALAASAARYALERGDWNAAAELTPSPGRFAHVDAITHFARAIGAARSGNAPAAKSDASKLAELSEKLRAARDAYWAEQVDIQRQVAEAWILFAEGKSDDALKAMRDAADAEDRTDKHVVTPGPILPAREIYGAMLLLQSRTSDALAAFETTLRKEPNRLGAMLGAGKAAEGMADKERALQHYRAALALANDAPPNGRVELIDARKFVSTAAN
jgi:tetratricopeptide (TPR) repeat protein